MRVYLNLPAGAGEVARQVERLEEVLSIVFLCAYQGQEIFPYPGYRNPGRGRLRTSGRLKPPGHRLPAAPPPRLSPSLMPTAGELTH